MIGKSSWLMALAKIELSMGLDFDKIISNRVSVSRPNVLSHSFVDSIVSLFPNIRELHLLADTGNRAIPFNVYRKFFHRWRDLEKLSINLEVAEDRSNLIESLNELESLETLILYKDPYDRNIFCLPREPFLERLKALHVPSFEWIAEPNSLPNVTAFSSDDVNFYKALPDEKQFENRFPALEKLNLSVNFDENAISNIINAEQYDDVLRFHERMEALKYGNVRVLEITQMTIYSSMYLHNVSFFL